MNEFNRCQTQLKELYAQGVASQHVVEFTCYQLLYCLFAQQHVDTTTFLQSLTEEQRRDAAVRLTLRICAAIRREDVASFFALYERETLPFECKHFMTLFFKRLRTIALYSLLNTLGWREEATCRIKPAVSLEMLRRLLHFESVEEAIDGLSEFGLTFPLAKPRSELTEADCASICIQSAEGLQCLRSHQQAEKGTKLL